MNNFKKVFKNMLFGFAMTGLFAFNATAGDVRVVVRAGNVMQAAPVITHYPNTVIYSRTPQVIYHTAPTQIQYVPVITQRIVNNRARGQGFNYYRQWNNGWQNHRQVRQRHHRHQQQRQGAYCGNDRRINIGHYNGNYKRRW